MNCQDARDQLSALLDDALATDERGPLAAHLGRCADCRRELERLRMTVTLLRTAPSPRAPAGFVERVLAAARPEPWPRRLRRWLFVPWGVKLPLEAAAALLVAGTAVYVFQRTPALQEAAREPATLSSRPAPEAPPPSPAPAPAPPASASRPTVAPVSPPPSLPPVRREAAPPKTARVADEKTEPKELGAAPTDAAKKVAPPAGPPPVARPEDASPLAAPSPAPPPATRALGAVAPEPAAGAAPPAGSRSAEPRKDAAEEATGRAAAALRSRVAETDVGGRLAVRDREAAERALTDLVTRLGGTRLAPVPDTPAGVVQLVVPRAAYPEMAEGLARIGRWLPEREPAELPAQVRVGVTLTD